MNEKNLIPITTESEAREKGRNGGIRSGQVRREKRTIQQILNTIIDGDSTSLSQFTAVANKLGVSKDKSIKELYAIICLLNSVKTANLSDLGQLQKLIGEQAEITNLDEQAQEKAHSDLIKALKERKEDENNEAE